MTIATRTARHADFPAVRSIIGAAFVNDELDLWDYLAAHDTSMTPDRVILADDPDGQPAACTVVLPRRIRLAGGRWVPGAVITLVACRPDLQGKGYGGATVRGALAAMAREGLAVAILHGHPSYYPRFGFAPVLPHSRRTLKVDGAAGSEPLQNATEADLPVLAALWNAHMACYPCAVERPVEAWAWAARGTEGPRLMLLPDRQGYAGIAIHKGERRLSVSEAGAVSADAAGRLLDGILATAQSHDLTEIQLRMPPEHLLSRLAALRGAPLLQVPAASGMAAITNWDTVLPSGYSVTDSALCLAGRPVLTAPEPALIQLVLGYRPVHDLLLAAGTALTDPAALLRLERDFPAGTPHWSLEVFWH